MAALSADLPRAYPSGTQRLPRPNIRPSLLLVRSFPHCVYRRIPLQPWYQRFSLPRDYGRMSPGHDSLLHMDPAGAGGTVQGGHHDSRGSIASCDRRIAFDPHLSFLVRLDGETVDSLDFPHHCIFLFHGRSITIQCRAKLPERRLSKVRLMF